MEIQPGMKFKWHDTTYEVLSPNYDSARKDSYWVKSDAGRSIQFGHIIRKGLIK